MNFIQQFVPKSNSVRPGTKYKKKYIVIHETGNKSKGANAAAHAKLLMREAKEDDGYNVSYHFVVSDSDVYQLIPTDETTFHSGTSQGNKYGISIEMCINSDGDYDRTLHTTSQLVADLYHQYNLWRGDVRQHWHFSGKDCPQIMRATGRWNEFLDMCDKEYDKKYGLANNPQHSTQNNKPTLEELEEMKAIEKCTELESKLNFQDRMINSLIKQMDFKQDKHKPRYNTYQWETEAINYMAQNGIYKGKGDSDDLDAPLTLGRFLVFGYRIIKHIVKWFVKKDECCKSKCFEVNNDGKVF